MNKQIFPVINTVDEFRANVLHRDEIREISISDDSVSFCYVIAGDGTFDTEWLRECRGIVFSKRTGLVTGRPLHKFFNVGEREETRIENLDWTKVKRVTPKYDGCCDKDTVLYTMDGPKTIKDVCNSHYTGLVMGWNHDLNEVQWTPILGHEVKPNNDDWYELEMEDGSKIKLTGNHLVWCINQERYVRVDQLTTQDEVQKLY
jgi:hypothetical protein